MSIPVAEVRNVTALSNKQQGNKHKKKRKRRHRATRKIILVVLCVAAAIGVWAMTGSRETVSVEFPEIAHIFAAENNPYDNHLPDMPDDGCIKLKINSIGGNLGRVFCDSNHVHLEAARALGIEPIGHVHDIWKLQRPLVEIKSCADYYVDDLTHSYPFLVPEAAELLHEIGRRFNAELDARGGGSYRLKVTSVLRTPATVAKLRGVNRNATTESTHQFGTTFDISYSKFICDSITVNRTQEDLKNLLGEVMHGLRNEGRCYVKYERKQSCFHITAR